MQRCACEETDKGKYTFFHHIASYMKDIAQVKEEEREGEARSKILSTIAQNETQYTRVCIPQQCIYLI